MDEIAPSVRRDNPWPQICRELREFGKSPRDPRPISQSRIAILFGVRPATWITNEEGRKIPRPKVQERLLAAYKLLKEFPKREFKRHRFPFPEAKIPVHCGAPAKFIRRAYSRARGIHVWSFHCRKCTHTLRRDKDGNDVALILSGNWKPLPFERPQCCGRNMNIWRKASKAYPEFPGQTLYFLWCLQPTCPYKGLKQAFVDDHATPKDVTKGWRKHKGNRADVGQRPRCEVCGREFNIFERRKMDGQEQIRFGCWRHRGATNRWFQFSQGQWIPLLRYKMGPRPRFSTKRVPLPLELNPEKRPRCHGKPMRLHEFPPGTHGGYRYRLRCQRCGASRWLDANLKSLPPRRAGRPRGSSNRTRGTIRRADTFVRERNQIVFRAKSTGASTERICRVLDSRNISIPRRWLRTGHHSWRDMYEHHPRLPVRLFSEIQLRLRGLTDRERDRYFHAC